MYPSEGEVVATSTLSFLSASRPLILVALVLMLAASAVGSRPDPEPGAHTDHRAGGWRSHYYGQFSHPARQPHYFPIMAWLRKTEQQSDIDAYVDFGLND